MALTREQVIAAFWEAEELDFVHIPPEDEIDYTFSEEFCRKRERLIAQEIKGSFYLMSRRKRKVLLMTAVLIAMLLLVGCSDRLREAVANMAIEIYETFSRSKPEDALRDEIKTIYEFTWTPEGYELVSQKRTESKRIKTTYQDKSGNEFVLRQYANNDMLTSADNEQGIKMTLKEEELILYTGKKTKRVTWIYDKYYFTLDYNADIELDEIEKMVISLETIT